MRCTQCGQELEDDVRFCPQCGSPVVAAGEPHAPYTDEVMHAEQKQGVSAQPQNESASFPTVMNEAKTRSKRRIPIVVLVALVLALTAGVAFAGYYVYVAVVEPMTEEASNQNSSDDVVEDGTDAATEEDGTDVATEEDSTDAATGENNNSEEEALASYDGILNEYRAFAAYVANGGLSEDLPTNETGRWTEYPDVVTVNSDLYAPGEEIRYQYAYRDLDGDGISELLMGVGHSNDSGVSLFQMFTYQNGEAKELFQSDFDNREEYINENPYFDLTTNGYIKSVQGTGGISDRIVAYSVYTLGNGELQGITSFAYRLSNEDTSGLQTIWEDGDERQVSSEEMTALYSELNEAYPWPNEFESIGIDDSSLGNWQDLQ